MQAVRAELGFNAISLAPDPEASTRLLGCHGMAACSLGPDHASVLSRPPAQPEGRQCKEHEQELPMTEEGVTCGQMGPWDVMC